MNKTIAKEMLPELWARLSSCGTLFLPLREGPVVLFQPWYEGAEVDLEAVNTVVSPKDLFLPRDEAYLHYRRKGQNLEFIEAGDPGPVIAFGVHPCDLKAAEMLDRVFLEQDPVDDLYQKRRDNTTVVVLACREPDPFCFCRDFGVDPADAPRADIMAFFSGQSLILESRTAKGEALVKQANELLQEPPEMTSGSAGVNTADFDLHLEGLPEKLQESFDDSAWEQLYKSCLGCGVCTYVCPTCYCFDIEDFGHVEGGQRFRCWDSCMYGNFTVMAGGHNPRPGRKERVRQRFLHKLQYYPQTYGEIACVGCGRCLRSCPVNLDIVQAIKALGGAPLEQQ